MIAPIKMLIGIGLLPLAWAVSIAVYQLYQSSAEAAVTNGQEAWALPIGFLTSRLYQGLYNILGM